MNCLMVVSREGHQQLTFMHSQPFHMNSELSMAPFLLVCSLTERTAHSPHLGLRWKLSALRLPSGDIHFQGPRPLPVRMPEGHFSFLLQNLSLPRVFGVCILYIHAYIQFFSNFLVYFLVISWFQKVNFVHCKES